MKAVILFLLGMKLVSADQIPDVDMHALTREIIALQKVLFSEPDFLAARNDAQIRESFSVLEKHLARLQEKVFTEQPALRSNAAMLSNQVADAKRAFKAGDKAYSRYVLEASLQMCIACHTRTSSQDFALADSELKGASTIEQGNFFFATRQFDPGRVAYEKVLEGKTNTSAGIARMAALSLATFYARVKADPEGGKTFFKRLSKEKKFSAAQKREFKAWSNEFARWEKEGTPSAIAKSDEQSLKEARELLAGDEGQSGAREISRLRASVLLNAVLEAPGETSPLKAEALERLGRVYEEMNVPVYSGFGDMYLKACISDYGKSKAAQECYATLETFVRKRTGPKAPELEEGDLRMWKQRAF